MKIQSPFLPKAMPQIKCHAHSEAVVLDAPRPTSPACRMCNSSASSTILKFSRHRLSMGTSLPRQWGPRSSSPRHPSGFGPFRETRTLPRLGPVHVSRNAGFGHKWKYRRTEKKVSQTNVGDPTKQSKLNFLATPTTHPVFPNCGAST